MLPQNSNSLHSTKQDNPNECPRNFNVMSPIRPSGNQQKRSLQQNVTPFTKFINQLSPISKIYKDSSLELQNFKNIEPNIIKKQKLNYYQTPSPKLHKTEHQKVDIQPVLQLTAHKVLQNLEINDEQTGNKNITYIKIKSPIINLNYSKISDIEDELNIYNCLENSNLESIIPTNLKQQDNDVQHNNNDISNFVYEFKFMPNKNSQGNKRDHYEEGNSIEDEDMDSDEIDEDDNFDNYYLHDDSAEQQQQQQQIEKIEELKERKKEIQTTKKHQDVNDTFASENYQNSSSKFDNKIQKFQQFETPKQTRERRPQKLSHHYTLSSELNLLKTKQQQKQTESQQQLNSQLKLKQLKTLNDQATNQQSEEKKKIGCNCKKSKCLKLYCDCFANGQFCTIDCNCYDCSNKEENQDERYNVMLQLIERNPCAFKPKVDKIETNKQEESHVRGCNCAKSGCIKKYCECFQAGVKCTPLCKCEHCKNKDESFNQMDN